MAELTSFIVEDVKKGTVDWLNISTSARGLSADVVPMQDAIALQVAGHSVRIYSRRFLA